MREAKPVFFFGRPKDAKQCKKKGSWKSLGRGEKESSVCMLGGGTQARRCKHCPNLKRWSTSTLVACQTGCQTKRREKCSGCSHPSDAVQGLVPFTMKWRGNRHILACLEVGSLVAKERGGGSSGDLALLRSWRPKQPQEEGNVGWITWL